MRSKKAIINTILSLLEDFVAIICSFILPKLILSVFGSAYNGLTTSISQFLACAVLLRSGIGGATKAALYKPLADKDNAEISSIIKATNNFMKKVSIILLTCILVFSCIYPFFVSNEFSWLFTFSLFLIIGISTFAESFFGITYLILLQADQKLYISSIFRILSYILNIVIATMLIKTGQSIHIVKLGSAIAFAIYPILLNLYVRNKYKIDDKVQPNNKAISQRWDAFWHQVAIFVNDNTDIMVLTLFTNMMEVSVYSVYNMIVVGLKRFMQAFTNGIDAVFGNMIAKKEEDKLNENLSIIEMITYNLATFLFGCAIILILQFVKIYTKGITDVNYLRPTFAYILLIAQFFYSIRLPYQFVTQAAGHFKQTKKYAIIEVILNISISTILVINYGLIGVAIGTLIAMIYKTLMYSNYVSTKIIIRDRMIVFKNIIIAILEFLIIWEIIKLINYQVKISYLNWIINGCITAFVSMIIIGIGLLTFYKKDFKKLISKLKNLRNRQ